MLVVSVLSNSGEPKPFSVKSGICSSCGALQRRRESWLRTVSPRPLTAVALRAHGSIQKSNGRGRTPACGEPKRVRACTSKCIRMQYGSTATGSTPSIAERRCSTALCPVCHKVCRLNNLFTSVRQCEKIPPPCGRHSLSPRGPTLHSSPSPSSTPSSA